MHRLPGRPAVCRIPRRPPTKTEARAVEILLLAQLVGVLFMFGLPIYALLQ